MAVSLAKIVNAKPATRDTLPNERIVKCPLCEQTFSLRYGENEKHHLNAWLKKADTAMRRSHKLNHEQITLEES